MNQIRVLVVEDSIVFRELLVQNLNKDPAIQVVATAKDPFEARDAILAYKPDVMTLDIEMPKMSGIDFLKRLMPQYPMPVIMLSGLNGKVFEAMAAGAVDFVHKPDSALACRNLKFKDDFLQTLAVVAGSGAQVAEKCRKPVTVQTVKRNLNAGRAVRNPSAGKKVVAIASSTGGPKALQSVIPKLPPDLKAPVLVVQHMPAGFTASLAERLDSLSRIHVKEAAEGDVLEAGNVYLSCGGMHMKVAPGAGGKYRIHYSDEPAREGVKPCANYMYESLIGSDFDEVVCVVMTGMGADGTKGIENLKAAGRKTHVIAQEESTCAVYGMPKSLVNAGLADQILPLEQIAQEITLNTGVM